jgi:hypothetical protein
LPTLYGFSGMEIIIIKKLYKLWNYNNKKGVYFSKLNSK